MKNIGQSGPFGLDLDIQVEGTFTRKKIVSLDKPGKKCTNDKKLQLYKLFANVSTNEI